MKKYFSFFIVVIVMIIAFLGCAEYYYPQRNYDRRPTYHQGNSHSYYDRDNYDNKGRGDRDDRRRDRDDH